MEEANPNAVLKTVKDQVGLSICPRTEEKERLLEMILEEETPMAAQVIQGMEESETLTKEDRPLVGELFDSLEVAHTELATVCSVLGRLSQRLRLHQLLAVLRASVHPMVQLNVVAGFLKPPMANKKPDLPDDQHKSVRILMTPDPTVKSLRGEKINSPTRLLAAA